VGGLPTKHTVMGFTAFPADGRPMLAATADAVWKSGDGARTWQRLGNLPTRVTALAIHPEKRDVIFAGTQAGELHLSEDSGSNWRRLR